MIALERAAAASLTVEALAERFLEDYARSKNLKSVRKYEQAISTHILPHLRNAPVDALDREQVRSLVRIVRIRRPRSANHNGSARGGCEAARRALGVLRLMVNWAIQERLVNREDNPASGMERHLPKKRKGDRVLSLEEIRMVWRAADSGFAFDNHARLMLLTSCRAGEWARAMAVGRLESRAPKYSGVKPLCRIPSADIGGLVSSRGSSNRSSAVRRYPTKLTPNLHQDAFENYTKCMIGDKIARKINGRGDRI